MALSPSPSLFRDASAAESGELDEQATALGRKPLGFSDPKIQNSEMPDSKGDIPASPMAPLMVQLLYETTPSIDFARLTTKVEEYSGRTDPKTHPRASAKVAHYFMLDALGQFKEGRLPSQLCLCRGETPIEPSRLEKALQQTWDWSEAKQVVASATHALIANDLMAAPLDPKVRNRQFRGFIRAIQETVPCKAMHWMNTQQIINPVRFVFQQGEGGAQPLYGSINVRLFNIQGTSVDRLMDTLGLAVLGLPDIQCHFRDLQPPDVARILYDVAYYVFEHGDIIEDGETVPGVLQNDKWRCQREMALVGPERVVLELNPGDQQAAGKRAK